MIFETVKDAPMKIPILVYPGPYKLYVLFMDTL